MDDLLSPMTKISVHLSEAAISRVRARRLMIENDSTESDYSEVADPCPERSMDAESDYSTNNLDLDLSLYGESPASSPAKCNLSGVKRKRAPLVNVDSNSQDSGYSTVRTASPRAKRVIPFKSFASSELTDDDDDFVELSSLEQGEHSMALPDNFDSLVTGSLLFDNKENISPCNTKPPLCRSISLREDQLTPNSSRICSLSMMKARGFKRPEPPLLTVPAKKPRSKSPAKPAPLMRSISENEARIMHAVHKSASNPCLIGDFTKPFSLPLVAGKHNDLKAISADTVAQLLQGNYEGEIASYSLIDCRYPYEYEGGHITGARNLYTREQILSELLDKLKHSTPAEDSRSHILVFHCEFSSERGPNLSRFLRRSDRDRNTDRYPALQYPEVYLLEGGYREFFSKYPDLCEPSAYKPMDHPDHRSELRLFRSKSRTWNSDSRRQQCSRKLLDN